MTLLVSGTQTQLPPSFLSEQVAAPALGSVLVAVASSGPPLFLVYSSSCLMHPDMQSTLKFMLFSPNSFSQHISQYYLPKQSFNSISSLNHSLQLSSFLPLSISKQVSLFPFFSTSTTSLANFIFISYISLFCYYLFRSLIFLITLNLSLCFSLFVIIMFLILSFICCILFAISL